MAISTENRKIFPNPCISAPADVGPLEFCNGSGAKRTRWWEKYDDISIHLDTVPQLLLPPRNCV